MAKETETHQFKLNLPADLRERIESAAERNRRSVTGEIIFSLETAYPKAIENDLDRALGSLAVVLNMLSESGDEDAIQQGLRYAQKTLDDLKVKDRRFWYTQLADQFVIMYTTPEEARREWTESEIAAHVIRRSSILKSEKRA